jgi:uncharacterized protein (DUF1330 family)
MPAAYFIGQIEINDPETYAKYREQVPPTIAKYGGEYLARGGKQQRLEGEEPPSRSVVLKFPSYEQALAWYNSDDYAGPKAVRHSASSGRAVLVEGIE